MSKRYASSPRAERARARILEVLGSGPKTAQQLADAVHLGRDGVQQHINRLLAESPRAIHIYARLYNSIGGRPAPQYALGDKPDAPYYTTRTNMRQLIVGNTLHNIKVKLKQKPRTCMEMALEFKCSGSWMRTLLERLRPDGLYIKGWQSLPAGMAPVYAIGKGKEDAPRPTYTPQERYARLKAKRQSDEEVGDSYQRTQKRRRLNEKIANTRKKPQGPFAALGI